MADLWFRCCMLVHHKIMLTRACALSGAASLSHTAISDPMHIPALSDPMHIPWQNVYSSISVQHVLSVLYLRYY